MRTLDGNGRRQLGLGNDVRGVFITEVRRGSRADAAGFRAGDVIIKINGTTVRSTKEFSKAVAATRPNALLRMLVNRKGTTIFVAVPKT